MDVAERPLNRELKPLVVVEQEDSEEDDEDSVGDAREESIYQPVNGGRKRKRIAADTVAVTIGSAATTSIASSGGSTEAPVGSFRFVDDDPSVGYRVVHIGDVAEGSHLSAVATAGHEEPSIPALFAATSPLNGGIYVINSGDMFPVNSSAPKAPELPKPSRDDKRRATHNEVERRRRDKINTWIMKLGSIIPECKSDTTKGTLESQSKGGILAKACDYITELRESNDRLVAYVKENEQLMSDVQSLGRQCEDLSRENQALRSLLAKHGISPPL